MRRLLLVLTALLLASLFTPPAVAAIVDGEDSPTVGGRRSYFFGRQHLVGDYTLPQPICDVMRVSFDTAGALRIVGHITDRHDTTAAEVAAAPQAILLESSTTSPIDLTLEGESISWRVDVAATAAAESELVVDCLSRASALASSPSELCKSGSVKGGGYNEATGFWDWVCGNYNWSAEVGGIDSNSVSAYNTPTTPGGNSWVMSCTGLHAGTPGTADEQTACLAAGEKVRMYSTADMVLAHDNVKPGGAIYFPDGNFHFAYCGQSETGTPNGCPVTREQPGVQIRKFVLTKGRRLVGAGRDLDGPYSNGRTGTYFLNDHGTDNDADGSFLDDTPNYLAITGGPSASTWNSNHWAWHAGPKDAREVCARPLGSTGCVTNTTISGWVSEGQLAMSPANIGYLSASIAADATNHDFTSTYPELCINDTIGTAARGVCSGDQRVQCTTNDGTRPTANTGGCSAIGLGTCIGQYEAIRQATLALPDDDYMTLAVSTQGVGGYGQANGFSGTSQSFFLPVPRDGFTGTTCAAGVGKLVRIGGPVTQEFRYGIANIMALTSTNSSMTAYAVPYSRLAMHGSGMSHLSIMPKDYYRGPICIDGTQAGCDELEVINFSNGFGVHHHDLASWYNSGNAGNHYGFSVVDGDPRCMNCRLSNSLISDFYGLASDASGWQFDDVVWQNGRTTSGGDVRAVIATAFGPESRFTRMQFRNLYTDALFAFQNSTGAIIRDTIVNDTEFAVSMLRLRGAINLTIDGITGFANAGALISAEGGTASQQTPAQIHISNIHLRNHHWNNALRPKALLSRTSYGGTVGFDGRYYGAFTLSKSSLQVHGDDNACLFFFDGMRGLDTTADEGLGFPTDDDRNVFHFEDIDLEFYNDGTPTGQRQAFCFGDHGQAGALFPGDVNLFNLGAVVGALPSWRNISIGSVNIPDNPHASMTSEEAGDCGSLLFGTIARVHDSDTAGVCEDSDNNGVMDPESVDDVGLTSLCLCDPTGNAGTGLWRPY